MLDHAARCAFETSRELAATPDDGEQVGALTASFNRFESLGCSCEPAMQQLLFKVNNLSLMRLSGTRVVINEDECRTEGRRIS